MTTQYTKKIQEEINEMSNRKLNQELKDVEYHIENFSFGRWEMGYQKLLLNEMAKREIKL